MSKIKKGQDEPAEQGTSTKGFVKDRGGPGPGAYMLPQTLIYNDHDRTRYRYPAYSMGLRTQGHGKPSGPGPQYELNNTTRFGHPGPTRFHMGIRPNALTKFMGPGPGAYTPSLPGENPPAYSFGQRVERYGKSTTPGPNAYSLPPTMNTAGGFTMGSRHGAHGNFNSPGPAAYGGANMNNYKPSPPKYSMGLRTKAGAGSTPSPGPGAYSLERPKPKGDPSHPKFGMKHTEYMTPAITEADNMDAMYTTAPPVCQ